MSSSTRPATPDFERLFNAAPGLYLVLTPSLHIAAASDAYLRATMTARDEIVGRHLFDVFPDQPGDAAATGERNLAESLDQVLTRRVPDSMAVQKYPIRRPEAEGGGFEERFWSPSNWPVIGDRGDVVFIIHRVEDVTEFVRLKRDDTQMRLADRDLRLRSEAMEKEIFERAQEVQETNRLLRAANAELNLLHVRDLTGRRKLEDQLRQAQKMEAVGQLAGGVAHDFNNLLTVMLGYSDVLLTMLPADGEAGEMVGEIRRAAERAAALTRQLLTFSRRQIVDPKVLDLNEVVRDTEKMLRRLIGEDVLLTIQLAPGLSPVRADPGQIDQVVLNLAVNARDAMPEGGQLTLETRDVVLEETYTTLHPTVKPGPYVALVMTDTGCGMSAEVQRRIFEPFFTTKELGKGSGLGLAVVHGIVIQSGGHVSVYSEPGVGTAVTVYLPVASDAQRSAATSPRERVEHGVETILLVEDEEAVRTFAAIALRRYGYKVLEAAGGPAALAMLENYRAGIDLLVTDVVMPGMSGRRVAEVARSFVTAIKVLYLSGYTDDAVVRHGILQSEIAFLQKPFTAEALARAVREVIDAR